MKRLWLLLAVVCFGSFAVLGLLGREIYRVAPPVPAAVVTTDGETLFTGADIERGRQVWQSIGGQQVGTVWGHGGYVAPDWSADWLHREGTALLDLWARKSGAESFGALPSEAQAGLQARLKTELRTNTYNAETGEIVVSPARAEAIRQVAAHYESLFGDAPEQAKLREAYAIAENPIPDAGRRQALATFYF